MTTFPPYSQGEFLPPLVPIDDALTPGSRDLHQVMMQRCLALALQAAGCTAPNPLVGCVIANGEEVVGEGFHPRAGDPHAEVFALRAAGDRAKGATAYVSLEPCNHFGRTPPCTEALIQAQVATVIVGMVDPDPRVSGRGIQRLRDAGIEVQVGVEEAACQRVNEAFIHRVRYQRPFGVLKYAMTLDGKIATPQGHSAWVTDAPARTYVHRLRSTCDAVIVGGNTVRHDNPSLTSHQAPTVERPQPNPLRVIMTRSFQLPMDAKLWQTDVAPTLVVTGGEPDPQLSDRLQAQGVEVLVLEQVTPVTVMNHLYDRGLSQVLWECGGVLAAPAIADGSVQKLLAFIAPKIIGGVGAPSPVGDLYRTKMTDATQLQSVQAHTLGQDFLIEGYFQQPETLV